MSDTKSCKEYRQPLFDFLDSLSDPDMRTLFDIIDVIRDNVIFDNSDESLIFSEFQTCLFIAAKSPELFKNISEESDPKV